MAKTSLQVKAKNAATERATNVTITYVNPDADSATLKQFGQMLNGFTNNVYEETNRIQTINVDTEQTPKQAGSIVVTNPQVSKSSDYFSIPVTALTINNGEVISDSADVSDNLFGTCMINYNRYPVKVTQVGSQPRRLEIPTADTGTATIKIAYPATAKYTAATAVFEVTVS